MYENAIMEKKKNTYGLVMKNMQFQMEILGIAKTLTDLNVLK